MLIFLVGVVLVLFLNENGSGKLSNLINLCVAFGTIASAAGLLYFGDSTYKNQKASEFHDFFTILINKYDAIVMKYSLPGKYQFLNMIEVYYYLMSNLPELNRIEDILLNLKNKIDSPLFKEETNKVSDFLVLFNQIITFIDEYDSYDRKSYINLIKIKTPAHLVFIAVLNSYREEFSGKKYQYIINKNSFLENFPINEDWLKDVFFQHMSYMSAKYKKIGKMGDKSLEIINNFQLLVKFLANSRNNLNQYFPQSVWGG